MELPPASNWPPMDDLTTAELARQYEKVLTRLTIPQLLGQLTQINGLLQAQSQVSVTEALLAHSRSADQPGAALTPKAIQSPSTDRAQPASPGSTTRPAAWELLSASQRLGPRLAAKLVIASARAQQRRSGE